MLLNNSKSNIDRTCKFFSILPQRMNDLITGARRFTVETSFKIETALNTSDAGIFYLHQAEHDIYLSEQEQQRQHHSNLSLLTKTTFWDVNLEEVNWESGQRWAVRRVLEYGEPNEVIELLRFLWEGCLCGRDTESRLFPSPRKSQEQLVNHQYRTSIIMPALLFKNTKICA